MKKVLICIILLILLVPCFPEAKTLQNMYDELAKLQSEYNSSQNKVNLTKSQISALNEEINNISDTIEKYRMEIKEAEADVKKSEENIANKKIETDGMIQFLQVSNGGNIYLEYLFNADSYTDFIYRYEVVKQLTNYNSSLIDELEALIVELQEKQEELKEKNIKLEEERNNLTKKVSTLNSSLSGFQKEGVDIKKDIEDLQKQIKAYEDKGCSRNQDITTCTASINASGWKFPLAWGCVTSEYTGYKQRTDYTGTHFGIDLDCVGEGAKVYPAADGVITRMTTYDCGGKVMYIRHVVNGKTYTTAYMHLLKYADGMYVGKVVTDDMVIAYMGGYSTSKTHGGYDTCTTGAHLHFGMSEGDSAYNFNPYSFNPREIFAFPKLVYSGGGYFSR